MSTKVTWRWSSLLVVLAMVLSTLAATVNARPDPVRTESAPVIQPPPPDAKSAPQPAAPQPPAVSPEEALSKIHPDLREIAQTSSPPLPEGVGQLAAGMQEPVIVEVIATAGTDLSRYFVDGKVIVRPPIGKGEERNQIFIGLVYPYTLMKIASLAQVEAIIPIVLERNAEPDPYPPDQPREIPEKGPDDWAKLRENADALRAGMLSWSHARAFGDGRPDVRPLDWFEVMPEGPHQAKDAWDRGYRGEGVTVAVLDDGIDPAHPDLLGTHKIYSSTLAPQYNGWPYVFSPLSMLLYSFDTNLGTTYIADGRPGIHYVDTKETPSLYPCGAGILCFKYDPLIDYGRRYSTVYGIVPTYYISATMTKSGVVHVGTHPDNDLRDFIWGEKVVVIVTDPNTAGVYDTVYVDLNADHRFMDEKPLTRANVNDPTTYNNMIAYRDVNNDGLADISGGMVYFIADGVTPIPGSDWIYGLAAPAKGNLVAFSGSTFDRSYSHGTQCASNIVGQGRTRAMLPTFSDLPGDGKPTGAVFGMAPDAKVVNISDIFYNFDSSIIDAYIFAAVGYDACDQTGYNVLTGGTCTDSDGIQITTNSYGESDVDNDGWEYEGQVVSQLQRLWAPYLQFLFSTGNGAPAYGTVAPPTPATGIGVGASTEFGSTGWDSITSTTQIMFNDVIPFSNRGPGARGTNGVDVVAGGAYAAGAEELNYYSKSTWGAPDGNRSWNSWGGTSRSAPVAGGVLALIYQAYMRENGMWPTHDVARALLMSSATDLNYDTFSQGAGSVNADRGTAVAGGHYGFFPLPAEWNVGNYRGTDYPGFAHIVYPGNTFTTTIRVINPTTTTIVATVNDAEMLLLASKEFTFTVTPQMVAAESAYGSENRDNFFKAFNFFIPITATAGMATPWYNVPIPPDTNLMIVRQIYPYSQFDVNGDYTWDQRFYLTVYNWKDVNGDGNLWEDKDGNGVVNFINDLTTLGQQADEAIELAWDDPRTELDRWEFGRFGYNRPGGNTYEMWVHDPQTRMKDGLFIGLRHLYKAIAANITTTLHYRIEFYRKEDVGWLDTPVAVNVPADGVATLVVTATVPNDMPPGMYQAGIYIADPGNPPYEANTAVVPVVLNVAAPFTDGVQFGGTASAQYDARRLYNNGVVRGFFDWTWRAESGDWRFFYSDLTNCRFGTTLLSEGFDGTTFPPTGWDRLNVDGDAIQWERTTARSYTGAASARHGAATTTFTTHRDGWLFTPVFTPTAGSEWMLFFWDFTFSPSANSLHSLWVCQGLTCGATQAGYTKLAEFNAVRGWRPRKVSLDAYAGQPVRLAFRYQQFARPGDTWYIDDVQVVSVVGCKYPTGTKFIVKDEWESAAPHTDIDTIVFGPTHTSLGSGWYGVPEPAYYGPYVLDTVAKSPNTYAGSGIWRFNTSTGANEDWVEVPFPDWLPTRDGLHAFLQHNVLFEADRFDVVFTKTVGTLAEDIHSFDIQTYLDAGLVGTTTLTATLRLNGLEAKGFLIAPETTEWTNAPLPFTGAGTIEWTYVFSVSSAYYLQIRTSSADIADLDLFLFRQVGNVWQRVAYSAGPDANEFISLDFPPDGLYLIGIDNYSGPAGHFNMTLDIGKNVGGITVVGATTNPVPPNTPVKLGIYYNYRMEPGKCYNGLVLVGPPEAPELKEIPLRICRLAAGAGLEKTVNWETAFPGMELQYTLNLLNYNDPAATFKLTDPIPEGTQFVTVTGQYCYSIPGVTYLTEGFESPTFPPTGWARYNVDGGGTQWERNTATAYVRTGTGSAMHVYSAVGMQDGWLRTPQITLGGNARLRFWEYSQFVAYYYKHSLWICTTGACDNPPTNYTQLAEFGSPVTSWREQVVDLSAYAGQNVYLAFRYEGNDADSWYIDDVEVSALPTEVCHRPIYDALNNTVVYTGPLPLAVVSAPPKNEGFEGGVVPPLGWTEQIQNTGYNWSISTGYRRSGTYGAYVPWNFNQNEWLLSPVLLDVTGGMTTSLWSVGSVSWCRSPNDNCDLNVWLVVNDVGGGDDVLLGKAEDSWPANWTWAHSVFTLPTTLPAGSLRTGYQYVGNDGADAGIDDIYLPGTPQTFILPSAVFTITVRISDTVAAGSWITNTASLTATHFLPQETQVEPAVSASARTRIGAEDFATSYKKAPAEVTVGDTFTYEIHVINSGDALASVTLTDTLPAGVAYVSHWSVPNSPHYTYNEARNRMEWSGNIAPREEWVFYVKVKASTDRAFWETTVQNSAYISWDGNVMLLVSPETRILPYRVRLILIMRNYRP